MTYSRRDLGRIALAAVPGAKLLAKPNSNFGGVQIGIIVSPVGLRDLPLRADQLLKYLVELGINAVELQDVRVESYLGAPVTVRTPGVTVPPEVKRKAAEKMTAWRLSAPVEKYRALRQIYSDGGIKIYAFRTAILPTDTPDAELDYFFRTASALGANQVTTELPDEPAFSARMGVVAAKHKMMVGYHNHIKVNFHSWDTALAQSPYNGINFDVGHYVAGTSQSPIPFLDKYHDRITCLHLKDRKLGTNGGANLPWGRETRR